MLLLRICSLLLLCASAVAASAGPVDAGGAVGKHLPFNGSKAQYLPTPNFSSSAQRPLPAIKVDPSGKAYTTNILKQQLANELNLPIRDFRIVDPSFPSQIQTTFTSRPNAILFCIENIKVVVQRDEALIFSPFQPEVQEFVPVLQQQLTQAVGDTATGRFEHVVLEAALNVVCSSLLRRVRALSPVVSSVLDGLRAESRGLDVIITQVDELLPLKNKIDELRKRVKEIKRAITDILNNDGDMAMMYLPPPAAEGPAAPAEEVVQAAFVYHGFKKRGLNGEIIDTMNLEMLFENYLNEIEWIASELEEMHDEIINTEENVVLQLDLLRNRILRFELFLSISSFVVTYGTLIAGLFGMNLLSHFEQNGFFFYAITALIVSSMGSIFVAFTRYGRREKLF